MFTAQDVKDAFDRHPDIKPNRAQIYCEIGGNKYCCGIGILLYDHLNLSHSPDLLGLLSIEKAGKTLGMSLIEARAFVAGFDGWSPNQDWSKESPEYYRLGKEAAELCCPARI